MTRQEMTQCGFDELDILFISGDAYVDHPSFATALLARLLESKGYKVGIIAQPNYKDVNSIKTMGKPRLCTMICPGNIDSMVIHYTASKKPRSDDAYSPGGIAGLRPDRPTLVYTNLCKQAFGKLPVIIGGIEASLRRFAHYDYWQDIVKKSILLDSKADLLVYGMGEHQVVEIADRLAKGQNIDRMHDIAGTVYSISEKEKNLLPKNCINLPSFEEVSQRDKISNTPTEEGKKQYAIAYNIAMQHNNPFENSVLIQSCNNRIVVQNPPSKPLSQEEFDQLYELPYQRLAHPSYKEEIPALKEVQFSITSNRGCFGSCSFCAITNHQGRIIRSRSLDSLVREATTLSKHKDFKGYIHDLGGPTANFQCAACKKQLEKGPCSNRECLYPVPCKNIVDSHREFIQKLKAVTKVSGVKKVFIRSGIRFDYLMLCSDDNTRKEFISELVNNHISGQLKIAPEHISKEVLQCMGKSPVQVYDDFCRIYKQENIKQGKKQYIIPYFIASHPGATLNSAIELALYLKNNHFVPDQVQEFYPTPNTVSTCMYYTGLDPRPGFNFQKVYVPKGRDANLQRALLQFNKKENKALIIEALTKANRKDLIPILLRKN